MGFTDGNTNTQTTATRQKELTLRQRSLITSPLYRTSMLLSVKYSSRPLCSLFQTEFWYPIAVPLTIKPVMNRTSSDTDSIQHWYLLLLHTQNSALADSVPIHYLGLSSLIINRIAFPYHSQLSLTHNTTPIVRHQRIINCVWHKFDIEHHVGKV